MTVRERKRALRKELLARRLGFSDEDRAAKSGAVCKALERLLPAGAGLVMAYAPTRGEVDPMPWVRGLWRQGAAVAFPEVREGRIVPRLAFSEADLAPGAYGILEPRGQPQVPLDALAAVLVPAVAYDLRGFRLGYGGGYYDRFLAELDPAVTTVGLAYDALLLPELPVEAHDRPVRWVVTESRRLGPLERGDGT